MRRLGLLALLALAACASEATAPTPKPLTLREGIDARMRDGAVAVVEKPKEGEPVLLACTRPVPWVNGAPSWSEDIKRSRFSSKWGAVVDTAAAPPLTTAELRGADCSRATHWVTRAEGAKVEYAPLRNKPVPLPVFLEKPKPWPAAACPMPKPGPPSGQGEMARSLYSRGLYAEAMIAFPRVADGLTGDDDGNQQDAQYLAAVSLGELGMFAEATAILEPIAKAPCHLRHGEAAFWLTIRDRRATF